MAASTRYGIRMRLLAANAVVVLVGASQQWLPDLVAKAKTLKVNAGNEAGLRRSPSIRPPQHSPESTLYA